MSKPAELSCESPPASSRAVPLLLLAACVAGVLLYTRQWLWPILFQDDFPILLRSWTWPSTVAGLWEPNNEHAMPLGRLATFVLIRLAGSFEAVPRAASLFGLASLVAGILLTYLFVRRETGQQFVGLAAALLFGLSSVYRQAVFWFASTFSVPVLDTLLLALLFAQRWRQTGRALWLDLSVLACLLAPGWFASGVLVGPLVCLYLWAWDRDEQRARWFSGLTLLPLAGTLLFLAVALPRAGQQILHAWHYGDGTAVDYFDPRTGLWYTIRSVADNLFLGLFGIAILRLPIWLVLVGVPCLAAAAVWWWWRAQYRRLVVFGVGTILASYLLTYSGRAFVPYDEALTQTDWSRYHLLPQLGLALAVAGGLPTLPRRWLALRPDGLLSVGQRRFLWGALVLLFLINLPRCVLYSWEIEDQPQALRYVDQVDVLCRQHHIAAADAVAALPELALPGNQEGQHEHVNGWLFLRGSPTPRPHSPKEIRDLLGVEK
jgi:hypothetical protein